jgi:excisionase family DNA binding protein
MENRLLTTLEVAERLGVHRTRVNVLIQEGRLPATRYGKSFLVQESDLVLVLDRKAGRPKKETDEEIAPGVKKWKAEQQTLPDMPVAKKKPAKRTPAQKKAITTKKGAKR